jgi:hypothetical protein
LICRGQHLVDDLLGRPRPRAQADRHDRPLILMLMGEPAEMKISEAFFSAISCRSFSTNIAPPGGDEINRPGAVRLSQSSRGFSRPPA